MSRVNLMRGPYGSKRLAVVTWKPPFLLPAQPCGMCGVNRGTTPSPWGDYDILVCEACDKAFSRGESDSERRLEEAAEAYHNGYAVVMW